MRKIYVNGGLPQDPNQREQMAKFYDELGEIILRNGFEPYVSSFWNSPALNKPYPEPQEIRHRQRIALTESCLVIIYTGVLFLDLGIDVELAFHSSTPVIIVYEDGHLAPEKQRCSEPLLGEPGIEKRIEFTTLKQTLDEIEIFIEEFAKEQEKLPPPLRPYPLASG